MRGDFWRKFKDKRLNGMTLILFSFEFHIVTQQEPFPKRLSKVAYSKNRLWANDLWERYNDARNSDV